MFEIRPATYTLICATVTLQVSVLKQIQQITFIVVYYLMVLDRHICMA